MIFNAFERAVAWRYLRARRQEGFVSVVAGFSLVGIAIGVATLIVVMAVMTGFRHELLGRILEANGALQVQPVEGGFENLDSVEDIIRAIPGVRDVNAGLQQQVMVMAGERSAGAVLRGVRPEELLNRGAFLRQTSAEALTAFQRGEGVIIGERLAEDLDLRPGEPLTLVSPEGRRTVIGTVPRIKTHPMLGVFSIGIYDLDSTIVFLPIDQAARFAGVGAEATVLDVFVNNLDLSWSIRGEILRALGDGYQVTDFQRLNAGFFATVQTQRNVIFLILTMIILVAALNIISGQIMLVRDKGPEIGILRTMGARRGAILRIFLLSGASIGVVGTAIGLALGLSFAANIEAIRQWFEGWLGVELFSTEIYYLTEMPSVIEPGHVFFICAIALGLSLAATLYPAWRAARLDPVEALRYE